MLRRIVFDFYHSVHSPLECMERFGSLVAPYLDNSTASCELVSLPAVVNIPQDVFAVVAAQWISIWFIKLVLEIIEIDDVVSPARYESALNSMQSISSI